MFEMQLRTATGTDYCFKEEHFVWRLTPEPVSPVTISVPHDGFDANQLDGLLDRRSAGTTVRDMNIWPIAKDIALRAPVNVVRGFFPRAFIDFNRSWSIAINYSRFIDKEPEIALEDECLVQIYEFFHRSITIAVQRSVDSHGGNRCLLIDLHGFSKQPSHGGYDLIFGTGNRHTVTSNIDIRLADFMTDCGYRVFLPQAESIGAQEDIYSADFITHNYHDVSGVSAIQIEVHRSFRTAEGTEKGIKLASDLAEFFRLLIGG